MPIESKPKGKVLTLSAEQKQKLSGWLEAGLTYDRAVALVKKEFGISTSVGALCNFWQKEVAPLRLLRRSRAAQLSSMLGKDIKDKPVDWDSALDDSLKELAFETMQIPGIDPDKVFSLMQCVYKAKDQTLKASDIKLKRDKFEFDAAAAALKHLDQLRAIRNDKSLDGDSRLLRARQQLFGELPTE